MINLNFCTDTVRLMLLGVLLAAGAGEATATLGQAAATPAASSTAAPLAAARMLATVPSARSSLYTLSEVKLENGTIVREYATPAGLVFAVAWRGPVLPDLSALLGGYFNTFKTGTDQIRSSGRRGSPVSMERDGLVVRSNGRMRNFFGHAYVPDLIPTGVNIKDVLQ